MEWRFRPVLTVLESRETPSDNPLGDGLPLGPLLPNGEPLDAHPDLPIEQPDDPFGPLDPIGP